MEKVYFIVFVVITLLLAGCAATTAVDLAKTNGQIRTFLTNHPNATTKITLMSKNATAADDDFQTYCAGVTAEQFQKITFTDLESNTKAVAFVDSDAKVVVCAFQAAIEEDCMESWGCTNWQPTECPQSGQQTRTCTDNKNCGTTLNKPIETQSCNYICTESWTCTNWTECTNGTQTRTCTDSANCGTITNKPVETQGCTVDCQENWGCDAWGECTNGQQSRTCLDSNNCGTTTNKPIVTQVCEEDLETFEGEPDFEGDGVYIYFNRGLSVRTTGGQYIVKLSELVDTCALFDVYKKQTDGTYVKGTGTTGALTACEGTGENASARVPGETLVGGIGYVDAENDRVYAFIISGVLVLEDTTTKYESPMAALFVSEGDKIKLFEGTNDDYILEVFRIEDNNTSLLKIYRKFLGDDYEFAGYILAFDEIWSSNTYHEITVLTGLTNYPEKSIFAIHSSKTHPQSPDREPELEEGANLFVNVGHRLKANDYIIELAEITEEGSSLFKVYNISFEELGYSYRGTILAFDGVISSNPGINTAAVQTIDTDYAQGRIGSVAITTSYNFLGFPTHTGDGNYSNLEVGESIKASNGYILKVASVKEQQSQILVYKKGIHDDETFQGAILALDGVVSSNTMIPITVETDDSSVAIGTITVTST